MGIAVVILAAGKGTRMNSDLPKVLHPIAQVPMLAHAIKSAQATDPDHIVVVARHGADAVRDATAEYAPMRKLFTRRALAQPRRRTAKRCWDYDGYTGLYAITVISDPHATCTAVQCECVWIQAIGAMRCTMHADI
jgi:N-acetylglucosamine-1-phosphate uridyltransferase (contains nucleotidyltransferase and I-patch acetyltransferase domains)